MDFNTLYDLERQARKEGNIEGLQKIFLQLLQLCADDKEIISLIKVLAARRGQSKETMKWLINKVYGDKKAQAPELWVPFAKELLTEVIEGKIYFESARVQLTSDLKSFYESQGNKQEALNCILNVPVETFTMIPETTVIEYQLEQFRLCLELKDWIRSDITMRKIRKKYFKENKAVEEEVRFYKYIVDLYLGQERFLDASTTYSHLNEIVDRKEFTILSSFYGILSTCEGEKRDVREKKRDLLKALSEDKNNEEGMRLILDRFLTNLLIEKSFINNIVSIVSPFCKAQDFVSFLTRAIDEHNFFVVEKFYKSISIATLSTLLDLPSRDVLERISFMVNNKLSNARIDQKNSIVVFGNKEWSSDVGEVLKKLVKVDHLIHKEKLK